VQFALAKELMMRRGRAIAAPVFDISCYVNIRCNDEIAASIPDNVKICPDTPVRLWSKNG